MCMYVLSIGIDQLYSPTLKAVTLHDLERRNDGRRVLSTLFTRWFSAPGA